MRLLAVITLVALVAIGCREDDRSRLRARLDPELRQQLEDLATAGTPRPPP